MKFVIVIMWVSITEPAKLLAETVITYVPGTSHDQLITSVRPLVSVMGDWSEAVQV